MSRNWNVSDLNKLAARGMKVNIPPQPANRPRFPKEDCKQVQWMHWNIQYWCNEHALTFEKEYRFDAERRWRFDFALPGLKVGIEYDGLNSEKSGHTTFNGYTEDTQKMNAAAKAGWTVLRYTLATYTNVLQDLTQILNQIKP